MRSSHIKSLESFPNSYRPTDFAEEPKVKTKTQTPDWVGKIEGPTFQIVNDVGDIEKINPF